MNNNEHMIVYAGRYEIHYRRPDGTRYVVKMPLGWELYQ